MRLSEYGILEDKDRFLEGDEVRCSTPFSWMSQSCDVGLDHERMAWTMVYPYWIGKQFGVYRKGMRGKIEGRRLLTKQEVNIVT